MYSDRLETICARLCLLSSLELSCEDAAPLTRNTAQRLISSGLLDGLVLRVTDSVSPQIIDRARRLLSRASAVFSGMERYMESGYRVLLPEDDCWPTTLHKLGGSMPLYLFARGNIGLLKSRLIAAAGSRAISKVARDKASAIGRILAREGMTLVCGGAYGVDRTIQQAVLEAGGSVIIIPAVPAREIIKDPFYLSAMNEGRLLILCETPPDEVFSAHKALLRNHTIYAMGMCSLVIASREGKGGSWAGARDCLKGGWSPVYALDEQGDDFEGNAALIQLGAHRMQLVSYRNEEELILQGLAGPAQTSMFDEEAKHADSDQD